MMAADARFQPKATTAPAPHSAFRRRGRLTRRYGQDLDFTEVEWSGYESMGGKLTLLAADILKYAQSGSRRNDRRLALPARSARPRAQDAFLIHVVKDVPCVAAGPARHPRPLRGAECPNRPRGRRRRHRRDRAHPAGATPASIADAPRSRSIARPGSCRGGTIAARSDAGREVSRRSCRAAPRSRRCRGSDHRDSARGKPHQLPQRRTRARRHRRAR